MHPAAMDPDELLGQCDVWRGRRGGPGGQHRNKVETAIKLTHKPSGLVAEANERRSQEENRRVATKRLRLRLAIHIRCPIDAATAAPSARWQARVHHRKLAVSESHDDFPALVAEALDWIDHAGGHLADAARDLGVSTSQLVRLLKMDALVWQGVNQQRQSVGWPPIR